jgi:hypothetical protein
MRHLMKLGLGLTWTLLSLAFVSGCGSNRDSAEEHRKLSLRVEHLPPVRTSASEDVEIHASVRSSLDGATLEAWMRILHPGGEDERIPFAIGSGGAAIARLPAHGRGQVIRYVIEARDAAGLVVSLPRGAQDGDSYTLRFEGRSSWFLGAISFLSAFFGTLLLLAASVAAVQCLRGRMSAGPAGMLGGFGAAFVIVGLLMLGGIHAYQVTGSIWPRSPMFLSLSRGDLALVALTWVLALVLGRRVLLDDDPEGTPRGERPFATVGVVAGVMLLLLTLF